MNSAPLILGLMAFTEANEKDYLSCRPLELRDALFVYLHSCIRPSRDSSCLTKEAGVTHRGGLSISLASAFTISTTWISLRSCNQLITGY